MNSVTPWSPKGQTSEPELEEEEMGVILRCYLDAAFLELDP